MSSASLFRRIEDWAVRETPILLVVGAFMASMVVFSFVLVGAVYLALRLTGAA